MDEIEDRLDIEKSIKKAKRKVYTKMIGGTLSILILVFSVITCARLLMINNRATSYARMLGNLNVFTSPLTYGGFGTNLSAYDPDISVYGCKYPYFSYVDTRWIKDVELSPLTLKMHFYDSVGTKFLYGKTKDQVSSDPLITILQNNPNSVASVCLTLDRIYQVEELRQIEENHDVEIIWLALETGNEYTIPENVTMDNKNAVRMFGIPTTFTTLDKFETYTLDFADEDRYMTLIENELKWTIDHRNYIADNQNLLVLDDINKVLKNGINVYGVVVVGPTSELIDLCQEDMVIAGVVDEVYPWDWSN